MKTDMQLNDSVTFGTPLSFMPSVNCPPFKKTLITCIETEYNKLIKFENTLLFYFIDKE